MTDSLGSISESLEPQLLGSGFVFTEGLLWHPCGYWLFVDPKGPLTHSYLRPSPSPNPPMDTDGQREDNGRGVREYRRDNPGSNLGRREVGGRSAGAFGGADGGLQWLWRARWRDRTRQEALADWASASLRGRWVGWRVSGGRAPSGWEWNGSQSGQGAAELLLPGPALGKMQGDPACRAGEPSGQGEDPPPEGLGGHDLLTQADAGCPASQGGPSPVPPAGRRWRRSGPRGDGSARRRT